jgi:hypothetical protein
VTVTNAAGKITSSSQAQFTTKGFRLVLILRDKDGSFFKKKKVTLHSDPQTATTDENGQVIFEDVAPGQHNVEIDNNGQKVTQGVVVEDTRVAVATATEPTTVSDLTALTAQESASIQPQSYTLNLPVSAKSGTSNSVVLMLSEVFLIAIAAVLFIFTRLRRRPDFANVAGGGFGPQSAGTLPPSPAVMTPPAPANQPKFDDKLNRIQPNVPAPSTVINPEVKPTDDSSKGTPTSV